MKIIEKYRFRVSISRDYYERKTDASACLSQVGAKAIGKEKMAFYEVELDVEQFLRAAVNGYTFCNLFQFDPSQKYWFETCNGQKYQTTPLYKTGLNQGYMRLEFKCDRFFRGAQTVFVDIDKTRFTSVQDYLSCLTFQPTCVYMSFSDNLEKHGVVSRRFRMVYVFDRILYKDELTVVARAINDQIVKDTGEPMEDDCGTRMSQYMNGVYGNTECYKSDIIYSRLDFPVTLPVTPAAQAPAQPQGQNAITFNPNLLYDMETMGYDRFMHFYSTSYHYFWRTERPDWINGTYQLTDDGYLQLWWPTERITDGNNRRRKLFKRACMRRLMRPDVDSDTLLFNMYVDFHRFIDNSDQVITLDILKRRTERAMLMEWDDLLEYCDYEIGYWMDHRQKFILHPNMPHTQAFIRSVAKEVHYTEIDILYDTSRSVTENARELTVSQRTLYRYCNDRGINTNPAKTMTEAERRQANRQAKADMKAKFLHLYDPKLSASKNREIMKQNGIDISEGTIRNWSKDYVMPSIPSYQPEPRATINDSFNSGQIRVQIPSSLTKFGYDKIEYDRNNYTAWNMWASNQ